MMQRLLTEIGQEPGLVNEAIKSWDGDKLDARQLKCHETTTHYKWFVHYDEELRYRVWLHQYKPLGERAAGHAAVPHNHRYSLASVILDGGFTHHFFERSEDGVTEMIQERRSYLPGDVYSVDWQQLHMLSGLRDHTLTLVVESPAARHFSEAFYGESGDPRLFYDFVELHSRLSQEIASIVDRPGSY
jgi:hypothetical protein